MIKQQGKLSLYYGLEIWKQDNVFYFYFIALTAANFLHLLFLEQYYGLHKISLLQPQGTLPAKSEHLE